MTQPFPILSEREYLRIERAAKFKSEYIGGVMYAMAGGTFPHARLQANSITELGFQLRRKPCSICSTEMRLRTPVTGDQMYPDALVVCGPPEFHPGSVDLLVNPSLIVEVLSPSTASYDRGPKFDLYRQFPAFRDYLIVHQDAIHVEHRSLQADGVWSIREYRGGQGRVPLPSIGCEFDLGHVYEGVIGEPE